MTSEAPQRLHVAAIAVGGVRSGLQLAGSLLVLAIVQGRAPGFAAAMAAAGIGLTSALSWITWRHKTYWLDDIALHYRSGVFTPDEKLVPRARVQGVDTVTGPVQRLFGVVELRVQVPGASDSDEIVLPAVTHDEAARLRQALGQAAPAEPDARIRLGRRGLLLAALTSPQISVAVSAVAGFYALFDNVVDVEKDGGGLLSQLKSPGAIALAVAVVLGAAYLLSFLAAVVVFAGFEVERDAQVLRIRRGLLERRAQSIPLERVDGVVIVEGLARGPLGLAALRLETAAHGGEQAVARTLLPLVRRAAAEAVIAQLVPGLAVEPGELERPPRRALRRFVLPQALTGAALGAVPLALWTSAACPRCPRCPRWPCSARRWACATTAAPACAWRTTSSWCARCTSPAARCSRAATACRSTRSCARTCRSVRRWPTYASPSDRAARGARGTLRRPPRRRHSPRCAAEGPARRPGPTRLRSLRRARSPATRGRAVEGGVACDG
jgi:putative membrane protein